jgi:ferrous iron transport protein B
LLLFRQIQDLGIPVILLLNQIDQAEKRGIHINIAELEKELGVKLLLPMPKRIGHRFVEGNHSAK